MAKNLKGEVDDVRVWNIARSYAEMERLKNRPLLFGEDVATLGVLSFDGIGWMSFGSRDDASLSQWTVESWFKTASPGVILQRAAGNGDDGRPIYNYRIEVNSNGNIQANFAFRARVDVSRGDDDGWYWDWNNGEYRWGSLLLHGDLLITDDEWHFAVLTFDGRDAALYLDGVIQDVITVDPQNDLPSIGDVDWHMAATDPFPVPRSYIVSNVVDETDNYNSYYYGWYYSNYRAGYLNQQNLTYSMATQAGVLSVGKGFRGEIDELRIFNKSMGEVEIESHQFERNSIFFRTFLAKRDFKRPVIEEFIPGFSLA